MTKHIHLNGQFLFLISVEANTLINRPIPWRSADANAKLARIDAAYVEASGSRSKELLKSRIPGPASSKPAPKDAKYKQFLKTQKLFNFFAPFLKLQNQSLFST